MTQLLVLGLLKKEALSGYDIQVKLQESDASSWGGVLVGSIYHALKKMEKDGYIEVAAIEQTGFRQKAIYQITAKGEDYFEKLLFESLQADSVSYPTGFYSGLNFLNELPKKQCLVALEKQRESLKQKLEDLQKGKAEKEKYYKNPLPTISELTFSNMLNQIKEQIRFIEEVILVIKDNALQ